MLEFTAEQVKALCEIDEKGFVERVRADLVAKEPKLAEDPTLSSRLWRAYRAARAIGIHEDENLVSFLRIEAYAPKFYEKPAVDLWLTRPGSTPDQRFHDYLRVIRWKIEHPDFKGGMTDGRSTVTSSGGGRGGVGAGFVAGWRSLIGGRSSSGDG
jgi:hypothetical protein